jgi:KaiC/GvpD/RAD55 family RecA-like ATPase
MGFATGSVRNSHGSKCLGNFLICATVEGYLTDDSDGTVEVELPIVGQLLHRPVKAGHVLVFMFDADSQWLVFILNLVAGMLRNGTELLYISTSKPLSDVRGKFRKLGFDASPYEADERLVLSDAFTFKTGRQSTEKYSFPSLNIADISLISNKSLDQWAPGTVRLFENVSEVVESSDEKSFLKFYRTWISRFVARGRIVIDGFVRGIHSDALYTSVMASADGVFELRTEEIEGKMENTLRVRAFKGAAVDTSKYILHVAEDLSVKLEAVKK